MDEVVRAAGELRVEPRRKRWAHLSLCVLDAVFSIGARYSTTRQTCLRYAEGKGLAALIAAGDPPVGEQPLTAFLEEVNRVGSDVFAAEVLRNQQLTSMSGGIRKAEAARRCAEALVAAGVSTFADVPALFADESRVVGLEAELQQVPGNSDVRIGYLWQLLGDDTVIKPDRMVLGWLETTLGRVPTVGQARELVVGAARALGCTPWELNHAIWTAQRSRPRLAIASDGAVKRRFRALQGRWREEVLGLPPGRAGNPRVKDPVDSMLPAEHAGVRAEDAGWNLMSDAAVRYARERVPVVETAGGVVERDRLYRNLLSSQPLAFSLVGELRAHPAAALEVLSELCDRELTEFGRIGPGGDPFALEGLQAEWAPDPANHTRDKSGFDIAAITVAPDGRRVLITMEVKYVDDFSRAKLDPAQYADHLDAVGVGQDAARALVTRGRSQFLRSVLLTDSVRRAGLADEVVAVVLSRDDDASARETVEDVGTVVSAVPTVWWSLSRFLAAAARCDVLTDWADTVAARYLPAGA